DVVRSGGHAELAAGHVRGGHVDVLLVAHPVAVAAVVVAAVIRVLTDRDVGGAVGRRVHPLIGGVAASVTADRPAVGTQPGGVVGRGRDRLRAVRIFRLGGVGVLLFVTLLFLVVRGLRGVLCVIVG